MTRRPAFSFIAARSNLILVFRHCEARSNPPQKKIATKTLNIHLNNKHSLMFSRNDATTCFFLHSGTKQSDPCFPSLRGTKQSPQKKIATKTLNIHLNNKHSRMFSRNDATTCFFLHSGTKQSDPCFPSLRGTKQSPKKRLPRKH
jgi:hypothetical protein